MTENKDRAKTLSLVCISSWGFGTLFLLAFIMLIGKGGDILASACYLIAALLLLPPVRQYAYKKLNTKITAGVRFLIVVILIGIAGSRIDIPSESFTKAGQNSNSAVENISLEGKQHDFYYMLLEEDFLAAHNERMESLLTKEQWHQSLNIAGTTTDSEILNAFKSNEVAAVNKFQGPWIISGTVISIEDSFGSASVALGTTDRFFNFNAQLENKARAAQYTIGDTIDVYCERIVEAATLIYGRGCQDYRDWKSKAFANASQWLQKENIKVKSLPVHILLKKMASLVPDDSICYEDFSSPACSDHLEYILKIANDVKKEQKDIKLDEK